MRSWVSPRFSAAAQDATKQVGSLEGAEAFERDLRRLFDEASETKRRTNDPVDGLEGRKTAIREKARQTKSEATEMMKAYLGGAQEALDGSSS
jgi:hypothetical protein